MIIKDKERTIVLHRCISNGEVDAYVMTNHISKNFFFSAPSSNRMIPGIYNTYIRHSPKFRRLCLGIYNDNTIFIDNFIYIHTGNDAVKDSQGCLLCGHELRIKEDGGIFLLRSRDAYSEVIEPIINNYKEKYLNEYPNYSTDFNVMKLDLKIQIL